MKVILALEVDLAKGTEFQLFQSLMDELQDQEIFYRRPDGEVYLHYGIAVESVIIGGEMSSQMFFPGQAKEWPDSAADE